MPDVKLADREQDPDNYEDGLKHAAKPTSCYAVPNSVPKASKKNCIAGRLHSWTPEMMTEDAKFALGF